MAGWWFWNHFYINCKTSQIPVYHMHVFIPTELQLFLFSLPLARLRPTLGCVRIPGVRWDESFTRRSHSDHQSGRWVADSARRCLSTYVWPGARRLHKIACTLRLTGTHKHTHTHIDVIVKLAASIVPHTFWCWPTSAAELRFVSACHWGRRRVTYPCMTPVGLGLKP